MPQIRSFTKYFKHHFTPQKNLMEQDRQVGLVHLPCESTHEIFKAGPPPATPAEPYRPQPQDHFTDPDSHAAPTSSHSESIQDTKITILLPGAAGIGGPMDDASDTYSSIYDLYFASSSTTVASLDYTVRTVNSHKSRYNTLPRHKDLDCGPSHLRDPQDLLSLGANDASVPEVCKSIDRWDSHKLHCRHFSDRVNG